MLAQQLSWLGIAGVVVAIFGLVLYGAMRRFHANDATAIISVFGSFTAVLTAIAVSQPPQIIVTQNSDDLWIAMLAASAPASSSPSPSEPRAKPSVATVASAAETPGPPDESVLASASDVAPQFTDVGALGSLAPTNSGNAPTFRAGEPTLRTEPGMKVAWNSPMGPFEIAFSTVLAPESYDKSETFRFSTSTRF